jgi:uncharacterized protein involved in exopolysaccharide biosynthesis
MSSTDPQPSREPRRSTSRRFGLIRQAIRRRPRRTHRVYQITDERPGLIHRIFRHHLGEILGVWLLGSLVAGFLVYDNVKPTYRALSLLRVDPEKQNLYNIQDKGDALEPFLQTQVQLITSPNVLTAAGTNRNVAALPRIQNAGDVVQELRKAVSVAIIPGTYLIEVSMTSNDGYEAATIVNAVVDAFTEANSEWSNGMTRGQIANLDLYNVELRNQINELERKWKQYAAKGNLDVPSHGEKDQGKADQRVSITIDEYRLIFKQLNDVKIELTQAEAWLASAKDALAKAGKAPSPDDQDMIVEQVKRRFGLDPEVMALKTQMAEARTKLEEAKRLESLPDDPAVARAKRKLEVLTAQWHTLWKEKEPDIRQQIELGDGGKPLDPGREFREAQATVTKLQAKQAALKAQHNLLDVKNKDQATDAVEIALIQDQRETLLGMQGQVVRRLEQLRYEAKGGARVRPVNANGAMVPTRPISDPRMLVLSLVPFAMLFVTLGLFAGIEARSKRDAG